jgi:hypothetical protein
MSDITIKPKVLHFQRNGVSGESFYTLVFDTHYGKNFIATFRSMEGGNCVQVTSCRVVYPGIPTASWRGDAFGDAIDHKLQSLKEANKVDAIYDLIEVINKPKKKVRA